jgi:cation transport regulator ChaC
MTWIFGYGSILWRPDFPHEEARAAALTGYARRFWQGSTDHRGVPGAPGRVVTLVEEPGAICRGLCFRVAPELTAEVLAGLDYREKGGYERLWVQVELDGGSCEPALTYVARPGNPDWLGPAAIEDIAATIRASRGPSGANAEYFWRLHRALAALRVEDPHLGALAALLPPPGA